MAKNFKDMNTLTARLHFIESEFGGRRTIPGSEIYRPLVMNSSKTVAWGLEAQIYDFSEDSRDAYATIRFTCSDAPNDWLVSDARFSLYEGTSLVGFMYVD